MFWKKLIFDFIKENKIYIFSYFIIILILYPTETLLLPKIYSKLFDKIETDKITYLFSNIKDNILSFSNSGLIWIIILIWLCVIFLYSFKDFIEAEIIPKHTAFMRKKIFSKTIQKYSTNFSELKIGKQITRMLETTRNLIDILTMSMLDLIPLTITIFSIIIYFLVTDTKIGIIMLISFIIICITIYIFGKKAVDKSIIREKSYLNMSEKLSDSFSNLINIYLNNESKKEIDNNKDTNNQHSNHFLDQHHYTTILQTINTVVSISTFLTIIILSYYSIKNKINKPSYFVAIFVIMIYYLSNLLRLTNNIPAFIHKMGTVKNSEEYINYIFSDNNKTTTNNIIEKGSIQFKNISFKYPNLPSYILKDINLDISSKERICLVGPSGSGKSTLVKLLLRMNNYDKGDIFIDDINVKDFDINYLRKKVIYVNQKTNLFDDTVINNIKYGNSNYTDDEIIKILQKYQLFDIYKGLNYGIHSKSGVNGTNLSLGMQKVTILVRGILKKGTIKILDEPLAGLDAITRIKIIKMIENECKNQTLIIITHDKEILPFCSKIINIKDIKN